MTTDIRLYNEYVEIDGNLNLVATDLLLDGQDERRSGGVNPIALYTSPLIE